MMSFPRRTVRAASLLFAVPVALAAQAAKPLPLKYAGPATKTEISAGDLMTRLYKFADDSMMGRQVGTEWNIKGTAYIESEVRRLGLKPAGDNGTYFQNLPLFRRVLDSASTITVDGKTFKAGVDFYAGSAGQKPVQFTGMPVIYGGMQFDTLNVPTLEQIKGKVLVIRAFVPGPGFNQEAQAKIMGSAAFKVWNQLIPQASALVTIVPAINPAMLANAFNPQAPAFIPNPTARIALQVMANIGEVILGGPVADAKPGPAKAITTNIMFKDEPRELGRNVVAVLPGSDPKLKGQYVAIGAHNDHVGFNKRPVDHDSVKAFMQLVRPQGADNPPVQVTEAQRALVKALTDSLRAAHGGARPDSIFNGADDDGSGSVAVLEIAEQFAKSGIKPKRSIIFVWHAGEEAGLWGSQYFTDYPTIPRDSIVAQLNMDMVGRGSATDATGVSLDGGILHGGPGYLQLVGSRRLSTELGDLMETVNTESKLGFKFDYNIDANGHPQNIYCRSDHYEYARYGIPVVFMTTGGHADYHQITDEPQYIDYNHMADISRLVYNSAVKVANLDHRIVVDKPKPDPKGACVQ